MQSAFFVLLIQFTSRHWICQQFFSFFRKKRIFSGGTVHNMAVPYGSKGGHLMQNNNNRENNQNKNQDQQQDQRNQKEQNQRNQKENRK